MNSRRSGPIGRRSSGRWNASQASSPWAPWGDRPSAVGVPGEEEDPPVIINETLAERFFPGEDPLGKTLVLAAVGLYGVVAYFARTRSREMGIRIALGARASGAAALVFRRGMALVGIGIMAGALGSMAGARAVRSWLFGVGSIDLFTLGGVSLFLAVVGCSACLLPSVRSMKVNPAEVLKED